jgi:hypothetical protein
MNTTVCPYSLGHKIGTYREAPVGNLRRVTTRFSTTPIEFDRPTTGTNRIGVICCSCSKEVVILVLSPGSVMLERIKRAAYIVATPLVLYAALKFASWGTNSGIIAVVAMLALFYIELHNCAKIFSSNAALTVRIARIPLLDLFPACCGQGSHRILFVRENKTVVVEE